MRWHANVALNFTILPRDRVEYRTRRVKRAKRKGGVSIWARIPVYASLRVVNISSRDCGEHAVPPWARGSRWGRKEIRDSISLHLPVSDVQRYLLVSVIGLPVKDTQNSEKEVDDVEIEADGGSDFFFDVMLAQDKLGVDEYVGAEDEGGETAIDELSRGVIRKEHGDETKEDKAPEGAEKVGHPRGEVILGLAGECGEEDEYAGCKYHGVEDNGRLVEGDDDGYRVSLGDGEEREEEQIGRIRFALPVGKAQEDERPEELRGI